MRVSARRRTVVIAEDGEGMSLCRRRGERG